MSWEKMSTTLIPTNLKRRMLASVWKLEPPHTHLNKYDRNVIHSRTNVTFGMIVAEVTALNW